jgi:hypothetical protein
VTPKCVFSSLQKNRIFHQHNIFRQLFRKSTENKELPLASGEADRSYLNFHQLVIGRRNLTLLPSAGSRPTEVNNRIRLEVNPARSHPDNGAGCSSPSCRSAPACPATRSPTWAAPPRPAAQRPPARSPGRRRCSPPHCSNPARPRCQRELLLLARHRHEPPQCCSPSDAGAPARPRHHIPGQPPRACATGPAPRRHPTDDHHRRRLRSTHQPPNSELLRCSPSPHELEIS